LDGNSRSIIFGSEEFAEVRAALAAAPRRPKPQPRARQVLALATAAKKRTPALPDVPTVEGAGIPDFDTSLGLGLAAPAGTPRAVIDKVAAAAEKAMADPKAVETLRTQGYDPLSTGPDQFGAFIRAERDRWSEVVRSAGLKAKT
jgi:tripartite-type tricarboxylate transporter receptor subunit TctC